MVIWFNRDNHVIIGEINENNLYNNLYYNVHYWFTVTNVRIKGYE